MDPTTIAATLGGIKGLLPGMAATPAGPSQSNPFFGSSLFNADSSGWLINFGGSQGQTNGDKVAPNLTGNAPGMTGLQAPNVGVSAQIPTAYLMIAGGALLLLLLLKRRG